MGVKCVTAGRRFFDARVDNFRGTMPRDLLLIPRDGTYVDSSTTAISRLEPALSFMLRVSRRSDRMCM